MSLDPCKNACLWHSSQVLFLPKHQLLCSNCFHSMLPFLVTKWASLPSYLFLTIQTLIGFIYIYSNSEHWGKYVIDTGLISIIHWKSCEQEPGISLWDPVGCDELEITSSCQSSCYRLVNGGFHVPAPRVAVCGIMGPCHHSLVLCCHWITHQPLSLSFRWLLAQSFSRVRLFATPWTVQPTRLLCPWNFPGKNTGVGCHFLLHLHSYLSHFIK